MTELTLENYEDEIGGWSDLCEEAQKALKAGQKVELYKGVWRKSPDDSRGEVRVKTVVIDRQAAGQVTNGDAVWGDWDEERKILRADPGGEVYDLDGNWLNREETE